MRLNVTLPGRLPKEATMTAGMWGWVAQSADCWSLMPGGGVASARAGPEEPGSNQGEGPGRHLQHHVVAERGREEVERRDRGEERAARVREGAPIFRVVRPEATTARAANCGVTESFTRSGQCRGTTPIPPALATSFAQQNSRRVKT